MKPFRTAAECIDWSIPMLSIFATPAQAKAWADRVNAGKPKHEQIGVPRRPLKEKTLKRIAGGLVKWVLKAQRPFIVQLAHGGDGTWGDGRWSGLGEPIGTVHAGGNNHAVVDATISPFVTEVGNTGGNGAYSRAADGPLGTQTSKAKDLLIAAHLSTLNHGGEEHRGASLEQPIATITGANDARALVAAMVTKHYGGNEGPGSSMAAPLDSITAKDHNALTVAHLLKFRGQSPGTSCEAPVDTITSGSACRPAGAGHAMGLSAVSLAPFTIGAGGSAYAAKPKSVDEPLGTVLVNDRRSIVAAFLAAYYGEGSGKTGHDLGEPMPTIVGQDRFGLVTVVIDGTTYVVTDIAMRMLTPRELLLAQGFPADYRVDITADGTRVTKADQVKLIGNSVSPPCAEAIAFDNVVLPGVLDDVGEAVPA